MKRITLEKSELITIMKSYISLFENNEISEEHFNAVSTAYEVLLGDFYTETAWRLNYENEMKMK